MGLNYSASIIIPQAKVEQCLAIVSSNNEIIKEFEQTSEDYGTEGSYIFQGEISILLQPDSFIETYLAENQPNKRWWNRKIDTEEFKDKDGNVPVGLVYVKVHIPYRAKDICEIIFTAATSRMSCLFKESDNIKRFFLKLSEQTCAQFSYFDFEEEGIDIFYCKGQKTNLRISGDSLHNLTKDMFEMILKQLPIFLDLQNNN